MLALTPCTDLHGALQLKVKPKRVNNSVAIVEVPNKIHEVYILMDNDDRSQHGFQFRCKVTGRWAPMPDVFWRQEGASSSGTDVWSLKRRGGRIAVIQPLRALGHRDFGEYACIAGKSPDSTVKEVVSLRPGCEFPSSHSV